MRITSTLLLIALAAISAEAALPPFRSAPLHDHLLEVNAQWQSHEPVITRPSGAAAFNDESERIRAHLLLVQERLAQRANDALTPTQRANRISLLQRLGDYANDRRFPSNLVVEHRNPVFIDPYGVACAVGWLMIESGHADLARSISQGFNLGYIREIIADARYAAAVGAWAADHGFTADELAWIQPGYPPNLPWQPLGGGTNGDVTVLEKLNDGRLLVAGSFTNAGGITASQVAVWDGSLFEALGSGVQGDVTCAVEHNGSIYLGGAMLNGTSDLARWNGTTWEFSTVFDGKYPYISALHVHDGLLHAAGTMMGFAGSMEFVQRLNGVAWEPVGSPFNGRVLTLATHDGLLVAGGEFTELAIPTEPIVRHVARFNGTDWVNLATGLDAPVRDLLSAAGVLYAGGDMINSTVPRFGLARIGTGASAWEMLMPNLATYIFPALGDPRITCLAEENGNFYFGGTFLVSTSMMTIGNNIARWSGVDQVQELAAIDGETKAMCVHEAALVIGGEFELWQPHLSALALTTRIDETPMLSLTAAPNPVLETLRLSGPPLEHSTAKVTLRDSMGREAHAPQSRQTGTVVIDASGLSSGAYLVQVDGRLAARFVKQ